MPAIQPATIDDIPELVTLVNGAYRGEGSKVGWTSEAHIMEGARITAATIKEYIENKNAVLLKYSQNSEFPNRILGCVFLEKVLKVDELKCYLGLLSVSPELQNRGIGKQLVQFGHDWARNQGCNSLILTVITLREELVSWYKKLGFAETGERQPFFPNPESIILTEGIEFAVLEKRFEKVTLA